MLFKTTHTLTHVYGIAHMIYTSVYNRYVRSFIHEFVCTTNRTIWLRTHIIIIQVPTEQLLEYTSTMLYNMDIVRVFNIFMRTPLKCKNLHF